jgi:hypothetical protein
MRLAGGGAGDSGSATGGSGSETRHEGRSETSRRKAGGATTEGGGRAEASSIGDQDGRKRPDAKGGNEARLDENDEEAAGRGAGADRRVGNRCRRSRATRRPRSASA